MKMLEAKREIHFIFYFLRDMGIPIRLPIRVRKDNVGAMSLAESACSADRTRYIDITYHFIKD
jgi:hypothetical protein